MQRYVKMSRSAIARVEPVTIERKASTPVDAPRIGAQFYPVFSCLAIPMLIGSIGLFYALNLGINWRFLWPLLTVCAPLLLGAAYAHLASCVDRPSSRRPKWRMVRQGCGLAFWALVLSQVLTLPSYVIARFGLPLQDVALTKMDQALGFSVLRAVQWSHAHPDGWKFFIACYGSVTPFTGAAIFVPALFGKLQALRRLIISALLAVILTLLLFALFPAMGPWDGYGFVPIGTQTFYVGEFNALRGSTYYVADPAYTCGLITFPSFHVALAFLSAAAFWPFKWLRVSAILLAIMIAISTVMVGWHYVVDGIAGFAIAMASVRLARRLC